MQKRGKLASRRDFGDAACDHVAETGISVTGPGLAHEAGTRERRGYLRQCALRRNIDRTGATLVVPGETGRVREEFADQRRAFGAPLPSHLKRGELRQKFVHRVVPRQPAFLDKPGEERRGKRLRDRSEAARGVDRERPARGEIGESEGLADNGLAAMHDHHGAARDEFFRDAPPPDLAQLIALTSGEALGEPSSFTRMIGGGHRNRGQPGRSPHTRK